MYHNTAFFLVVQTLVCFETNVCFDFAKLSQGKIGEKSKAVNGYPL